MNNMRYPTRAAIDKFNNLLGLHEEPFMQDWEIECADPARVAEFIDCYDTHAHSDDEKFTMMALILGSYEEYHGIYGPGKTEWIMIRDRLLKDMEIHFTHVDYYSCLDTEDDEEWFPITKLIRKLHPALAQQGI